MLEISETFYLDIRNQSELQNKILEIEPDFVFHLAAQALVHIFDNNRNIGSTQLEHT